MANRDPMPKAAPMNCFAGSEVIFKATRLFDIPIGTL